MKRILLIPFSLVSIFAIGCSSVDMPKGKVRGFESARLVDQRTTSRVQGAEDSPEVNRMVQEAIAAELEAGGVRIGGGGEDLIVAYMIIHQTTGSTTMNSDHFGYGRNAEAILLKAHEEGVIKNESPDFFEAGAIVIDLLDARTNKLVFRNFAKRAIGATPPSPAVREARIRSAVNEALAPFFR